MKEIQILLKDFTEKLNKKISEAELAMYTDVFYLCEELHKEMLSSLSGSNRGSKRARVKSVELSKSLKFFRKKTVGFEKERKLKANVSV